MASNKQIFEWKKEALLAELKNKKVSFNSSSPAELYEKWKLIRNFRRTLLILSFLGIESLLFILFYQTYAISFLFSIVPLICIVGGIVGFCILWFSKIFNAVDIEKYVTLLSREDIRIFNESAHDMELMYEPFYEDNKPCLSEFLCWIGILLGISWIIVFTIIYFC